MALPRDPEHPDWLVIEQSGVFARGCWFLVASGCAVLSALAVADVEINGARAGPLEIVVFGLLALIFGSLVGRRSRTRLNPQTGELVTDKRFWHLKSEHARSAGKPQRIKIGRDHRGTGSSSRTVYPVTLFGSEGHLELSASSFQSVARDLAHQLSQAMLVPMEDKSEYVP
jgi:hypothetical protein